MKTQQAERDTYYILAGEGNIGRWKKVKATKIGIKRILTNERCGGDRFAIAFETVPGYGGNIGWDIETGEPRDLPTDLER